MVRFGEEGKVCFLGQLDATVEHKGERGEVTLAFAFHGPVLDQAIEERGDMPLPPYIAARRAADEQDRADYQTRFARQEGAVAAPTAGLHFTDALVARARGARHRVAHRDAACRRRHVPAGDGRGHRRPHDARRMGQPRRRDRRRAQCGARGGRPHRRGRLDLAAAPRKRGAARTARSGRSRPRPSIFITPGYRFRAVDVMLTNFHLPRSTLFMLVAAFSGLDTMQRAYAHAIATGYRFYSYGDACLLFRGRELTHDDGRLLRSSCCTPTAPRAPGAIRTPRGTVRTPAFMPVGTQGALKAVHWHEVREAGADIVLGNTYHLMLRPGRRAHRGARRPAPLHQLAASDPHRLRRLPGHVARRVCARSTRTA